MKTFVSFTSVDGSKHEIRPDSGDRFYEGNLMPNGSYALFFLLHFMNSLFFYFIEKCESICKTKENFDYKKR